MTKGYAENDHRYNGLLITGWDNSEGGISKELRFYRKHFMFIVEQGG